MAAASAKVNEWTCAALNKRLVRYDELIPCYNAFIDCRTPGSETKENFTIIGPGVSENPDQHVHIAEPHGFNIGGARQPPGCVNSQHSHDTAEVFVVHSGEWRFDLGEQGDDAQVHLSPGDVISIPVKRFRGFTATAPAEDGSPGFLWAVLGEDNPGRVLWAPEVFDMASTFGLVLLENGSLVDTAAGGVVPKGAQVMQPTTKAQAEALVRISQADAETIVWRNSGADSDGAAPIIGKDAPFDWPHGFWMDRLTLAAGEDIGWDQCDETEVLYVNEGELTIAGSDGVMLLKAGDTISLPAGLPRNFESVNGATAFLVGRE